MTPRRRRDGLPSPFEQAAMIPPAPLPLDPRYPCTVEVGLCGFLVSGARPCDFLTTRGVSVRYPPPSDRWYVQAVCPRHVLPLTRELAGLGFTVSSSYYLADRWARETSERAALDAA